MSRRALALFLLVLTVLHGSAKAGSVCSRERVCITVAEQATQVRIDFQNLQPYPVVVHLRMWGKNVRIEPSRERSFTLSGKTHQQAGLVTIKRAGRPWRYRYRYDWVIGSLEAKHDVGYRYRLPYATGESYPVLQGFNGGYSHKDLDRYAVDFDMPEGTAVHAARAGVVADIENQQRGFYPTYPCQQEANYIVILHADGTTGEYYHLRHLGAAVSVGQDVARGQLIGYSGNTGCSNQPHLHFAVYRAAKGATSQSLPIRFITELGTIDTMHHGDTYQASD